MNRAYRLLVTCPDRVGIVAAVSGFCRDRGGSIAQANQYADPVSNTFFMRYVLDAASLGLTLQELKEAFSPLAEEYQMNWQVTDASVAKKVVIMVSKLDHCLDDLLYRWRSGDLHMDITAVISNHDDFHSLVEGHDIPFHHIAVPKDDKGKAAAFAETARVIDQYQPDTIVLARYMQILPPWMCERYPHQVINIHHSFLPSFAGARPYHQAKERGVKLTGATCHYVTEELDAGPIIEQDVIRISHDDPVEEIIRLGKDVESRVLSKALRSHLEDRVLVQGNKTIVF